MLSFHNERIFLQSFHVAPVSAIRFFYVCKRIQVLTKSIDKRIICFFRFIHFVYKLNLSLRAMYMNVTIYCCKRGVKHRIKDQCTAQHTIHYCWWNGDRSKYIFFSYLLKKKGEKGRYRKQEMWCHFRNINLRQSDLEGLWKGSCQ